MSEHPEAKEPFYKRFPETWFAVTETLGAGMVLLIAWYFDFWSYCQKFADWLIG